MLQMDNKTRTGLCSMFNIPWSSSVSTLQTSTFSSTSSSLLSLRPPPPYSSSLQDSFPIPNPSPPLDDSLSMLDEVSESFSNFRLSESYSIRARAIEDSFRRTNYRTYSKEVANEIEEAKNSLLLLQVGRDGALPFRKVLPLRRTLTQQELDRVRNAVSLNGSEKEVIVEGHKVSITRKDLRTLRDNGWLNDEIVNMIGNLVKDFIEKIPNELEPKPKDDGRAPKIYLPLSFFVSKLMSDTLEIYSFDNVKRWTTRAKTDIFSCDFVIFPRNISNTHWACVFLDMKKKIIWNLDSLGSSDKDFCEIMLKWLQDEHFDKKKSVLPINDWTIKGPPADLPRQNNGVDCGVFLCMFAYFLAQGRIPTTKDFSQKEMSHIRKLVTLWILDQKIS
jgi:Ulp1 family protease